MVDAELGLQPVRWLFFARQLQHQRMHADLQRRNLLGRDALGPQLRAAVNARVDHNAAGKRLEGVERDFKLLAQTLGDFGPVIFSGDGLHHAAWRLQRLGAGGKALLRQQRRHQTGAGCATGVKRLGHAAKLFAHANGLRGGNAQRHGGLRLGQAQEARAACRRAHGAGRTGDVPAPVVVVRVHGIAHAAGHIDAQHQRVHQRAPAGAGVLGQRQQRRGHRPCRVDDGFEVRVVKVKSVRADAIEQGRAGHVHFVAAAQHAGLGRRL